MISSINSASPFRVLLCGHTTDRLPGDPHHRRRLPPGGKAGGIRLALAQGKRVTVLGRKRLTGVMGLLLRNGEVRTDIELTDLYIDCGFTSRAEALELVAPGISSPTLCRGRAGERLHRRPGAGQPPGRLYRAPRSAAGPGEGAKVGVFCGHHHRRGDHHAGRLPCSRPGAAHAGCRGGCDPPLISRYAPPSALAVSSGRRPRARPRARCARLSTGRWRRPPGGWDPCSMPSPPGVMGTDADKLNQTGAGLP